MARGNEAIQKESRQLYDELVYALNRISRFNQVFGDVLPDREYQLLKVAGDSLAKFLDQVKM